MRNCLGFWLFGAPVSACRGLPKSGFQLGWCFPVGVVFPSGDLAEPISWLVLKTDTKLNHLKELDMPLWKSTFKNKRNPGKTLLASGL